MKRGGFRECHVSDTSVLKNQDKSWPEHVFCGVSRNIRRLILNNIKGLITVQIKSIPGV